jgi:hypothetical protein
LVGDLAGGLSEGEPEVNSCECGNPERCKRLPYSPRRASKIGKFFHKLFVTKSQDGSGLIGIEEVVDFRLARFTSRNVQLW